MGRYWIRRLIQSVGIGWLVLTLVFLTTRVIGDPVRLVLGIEASHERVELTRETLGLNRSLLAQYADFIGGVVRVDFGESFWQKVPSLPIVLDRVPATLYLTSVALLMAVPLALVLASIGTLRPRSFADRAINVFSLGGVSIVDFWLGLMFIMLLATQIDWLKTSGYGGFSFVLLPAATLAFKPLGRISQMARTSLAEEMAKPYIRSLRAKGLSPKRIVFLHAMKNASLPIITVIGDELISLLNGAIVVETVFGWPGLGQLTIQALGRRDLPVIEALVFVVTVIVIGVNLLVDASYTYLNPKVTFGDESRGRRNNS